MIPQKIIKELEAHELPSIQEELDFLRRSRAGDDSAASEMVERCLQLAIPIVRAIAKEPNAIWGEGDLLSECSLAIMDAFNKWDPQRGRRFTDIAKQWCRLYIRRHLREKGSLVKGVYETPMQIEGVTANRELSFKSTEVKESKPEVILTDLEIKVIKFRVEKRAPLSVKRVSQVLGITESDVRKNQRSGMIKLLHLKKSA